MATFDLTAFDAGAFDTDAVPDDPVVPPTPDPVTTSTTVPLFDGKMAITIGGLDVTAAALPGLRYSTTSPGGFGEASMRLPATDPFGPYVYPSVIRDAPVFITHDGYTLHMGTVLNDVDSGTIDEGEAYYEVASGGGYAAALLREDYCVTYVDTDITQWFLGDAGARRFIVDNDGRLAICASEDRTYASGKGCSWRYWLNGGLGDSADYIDHLEITLADYEGTGNGMDLAASGPWEVRFQTSTHPWGTWTKSRYFTADGGADDYGGPLAAGKVLRIPETGSMPDTTQAVRMMLIPSSAPSMTADRFVAIEYVKVVGTSLHSGTITSSSNANPTTITTSAYHRLVAGDEVFISDHSYAALNGYHTVATVPTDDTFTVAAQGNGTGGSFECSPRVDEAIADIAVATGLASSAKTGAIGNTLAGDVVVRPYATRADAIEQVAALSEDPVEWGFWEEPPFSVRERTAPTGIAANRYLIDATVPGIDYDVHSADEGTPDHVRVLYKFRDSAGGSSAYPDGTLRQYVVSAAGSDTLDWTTASQRVAVLDMSDVTMTEAQAGSVGQQYLDFCGRNAFNGTITIRTPQTPLWGGGTVLTAYIRAGGWIQEVNADTGPLYITETDYDVDSATMTIRVGEDASEFRARIYTALAARNPRVGPQTGVNPPWLDRFGPRGG